MALIVADRVQETTTTTGTGTYTLAGAKDGFQSFAAVGDGNTTYYACTDGTDYEVGIGTYTATGTTLARTTIIDSSNSDLAVSWGAGSKDIFVTSPADKTLLVGRNLYADNPSTPTAQPSATGANAVAIGDQAIASGDDSLAFGEHSDATASRSFSFGFGATATHTGALALGTSRAFATDAVAIGIDNNSTSYGASGANSIAMGQQAKATGIGSVSLGYGGPLASGTVSFAAQRGQATGNGSIAMGHFNTYGLPTASGLGAIVIGDGSTGSATRSVVLGNDNTSSHIDAVVIGQGASSSAADQITLGHTDQTVRISSSYTLPTSDGTNGQVLTTDGAGAVTFADAGGGSSTITVDSKTAAYTIVSGDVGKLISFSGGSYTVSLTAASTLGNGFYVYIENNAAAGQNTHVITIDPNASETIDGRSTMPLRQGQRILIVCDGSNWKTVADFNRAIATNATTTFFNLPQATGDESVAIGLGSVASNTNTTAIGLNAEATGSYATSFGTSTEATAFGSVASGYNAVSAGSQSIALGVSRASGDDSFAAAIASNSSSYGATGANSIAIGYLAKASGNQSTAIGDTAQATGLNSICIGDAVASGRSAIVIDGEGSSTHSGLRGVTIGYSSTGSADYSAVIGSNANDQGIIARFAFSGSTFNNDGDSQQGMFPLRLATTDATPAALTTNGGAASTDNQIILPNNSAYSFSGTIIARQQAASGSNYASWEIKGALLRDANAASTVLGNGIVNKLYATAGASAWAVALSADTTNGGLKVEVTGAAATNIRWVATVNTSEVTYA